MGGLIPKGCSPEDCQTSKEAREIAKRLEILGGSAAGDATGEFGWGNSLSAASRYKEAARFHERANYLESIGK